ncbi:MAG: GNAT family N-acetyltransferase [Halobacteria archaeon]|nr:GNAT family N-acetyltransferase [Halobacteria archaeon]
MHPTKFEIIVVNGNEVGAYLVNEEFDHYWLEMLLIDKKMQRHGLGTAIINKLQMDSEKSGKPLKLSVLKVNPAKKFYSRLGFHIYDEDESFFKMAWVYNKPIQPTQNTRG